MQVDESAGATPSFVTPSNEKDSKTDSSGDGSENGVKDFDATSEVDDLAPGADKTAAAGPAAAPVGAATPNALQGVPVGALSVDNPYFELPEELKNRHLYLTTNNGPLELDEFSDLSPRFVRELLLAQRALTHPHSPGLCVYRPKLQRDEWIKNEKP